MAAQGLSEADARDLIGRAVQSFAGRAALRKAMPAIDAAFELARQSSKAAGTRTLTIRSIKVQSVGENEDDDSVVTIANQSGPPVNARRGRIPIRYGGTGYTCYLISVGPPPLYICIYW